MFLALTILAHQFPPTRAKETSQAHNRESSSATLTLSVTALSALILPLTARHARPTHRPLAIASPAAIDGAIAVPKFNFKSDSDPIVPHATANPFSITYIRSHSSPSVQPDTDAGRTR